MVDETCIGIDLGTTNSVVARLDGNTVEVFADDDGYRLQPSVVAFTPKGEIAIGMQGRLRRIIDPPNTIYSAKRLMGQAFQAPHVQQAIKRLPYRVEEGPRQEPTVSTRAGRHTVTQISGLILEYLRKLAERRCLARATNCVVTVPANFTDTQREATRIAANLAGMKVLRVLNEPTAAALAYGHQRELHQRIAVFDFGGGTFDLTVLQVREGIYEVLATGGDSFLGGDDMDRMLAGHLADLFLREHRVDLRTDRTSVGKLLVIAEYIKLQLSDNEVVEDTVKELAYGDGGRPLPLTFRITRGEFEAMVRPIVEQAIARAEQVLADAGIAPAAVDEVILAGGATLVPLVRKRVTELFGCTPHTRINPMEVVALGAAIHADNLYHMDPLQPGPVLMDVTSHALGIGTAGGYAEQLIAKNTPIPAEGTRVFTTARDNQTIVDIKVCQGPAVRFAENVQVGELRLDQLRAAPRGQVRIEVFFQIDADGILAVVARDLSTGKEARAILSLLGISTTLESGLHNLLEADPNI